MPATRMKPAAARRRRLRSPAVDPPDWRHSDLWRISVDQYEEMIQAGILTANDPVELLDGCLVRKMPKTENHILSGKLVQAELAKLIPSGWHLATQNPIRLSDSQPEPDADPVWLLARITRKSADGLALQVGDALIAQIKGVALM